MFSDEQLTAMRETAGTVMDTPVVVSRKTRTSDGAGGFTTTTTSVWNGKAHFASIGINEWSVHLKKIVNRKAFTLRMPYNADVQMDDLVEANNTQYQVLAVDAVTPLVVRRVLVVEHA